MVIGNEKYALHLLPSGILTEGVTPVISNGVVIDPEVLFHEIEALNARGIDTSRLRVSANAHIITSYNVTLDKTAERFLGKRAIGTTGRGIGPTYADKINRVGIRVQDLFDESILRQKVEAALVQKNNILTKVYNRAAIKAESVVAELLSFAERLRPMVADTALELHEALEAGKTVLFEGGQATMLDVDHGTYPFVTSSSASSRRTPLALALARSLPSFSTTRVSSFAPPDTNTAPPPVVRAVAVGTTPRSLVTRLASTG